jgi:hypothetical protein
MTSDEITHLDFDQIAHAIGALLVATSGAT